MHWSLAGSVPQRAGAVCRPTTTEQVAAVLVRVRSEWCASHARRRAKRRLGGVGAGVRWCRARPHRDAGHRRHRCRFRSRRGVGGHVRTRPRDRVAPALRDDHRSLPAELRHRHGRWMGRVPRRRAVQHPLRQDRRRCASGSKSCWPMEPSCRQVTAPPQRWGPTSRSCSSAAKARSASSLACGCAPIPFRPTSVAPRTRSPTSSRASRPAA